VKPGLSYGKFLGRQSEVGETYFGPLYGFVKISERGSVLTPMILFRSRAAALGTCFLSLQVAVRIPVEAPRSTSLQVAEKCSCAAEVRVRRVARTRRDCIFAGCLESCDIKKQWQSFLSLSVLSYRAPAGLYA
jgi:hypothetical protein